VKKAFRSLLLLVLAILSTLSAPAQGDGPSYEETVRYIQERLGQFEEDSHCNFTDHDYGAHSFNAADLSRHIYEDGVLLVIDCARREPCVSSPKSKDGTARSVAFRPRDGADRSRLQKAFGRLLDLCGVPPQKDDPFK
jgi:hypothetical protein